MWLNYLALAARRSRFDFRLSAQIDNLEFCQRPGFVLWIFGQPSAKLVMLVQPPHEHSTFRSIFEQITGPVAVQQLLDSRRVARQEQTAIDIESGPSRLRWIGEPRHQ